MWHVDLGDSAGGQDEDGNADLEFSLTVSVPSHVTCMSFYFLAVHFDGARSMSCAV